ncbi:uncharacterized protein LOC141849134 [Brevipalpus obovatus]|uniref:uncharacterized protein LOC141849134 n=1 Tax=Brevipalpus obovatus TaxID=246614 RepID=UPI003D9EC475
MLSSPSLNHHHYPYSSHQLHQVHKQLRLRNNNYSEDIISGFSKLLKSETMTDVTLICSGGQTIRAHRVILSTFSPYFRAIFESQPFANNPCQYPVIVIKDLGLSELRAVIEFMYRGEISLPREKIPAVIQAGKELEVTGLNDIKLDQASHGASGNSTGLNGHVNGNSSDLENTVTISSAYGGSSAAIAAASSWKPSLDSIDSHGSSLFDDGMKKLRITTNHEGTDRLGISILGDGTGNENVRSLLHQPNRVSAGLNHGFNLNKNRSSMDALLAQKQNLMQRKLLHEKIRIQQQQAQIRQQLMQHQMNMQKGSPNRGLAFNQFQARVKAQIMEIRKENNGPSSRQGSPAKISEDDRKKVDGEDRSKEDEEGEAEDLTINMSEKDANEDSENKSCDENGGDSSERTQTSKSRRVKMMPRKNIGADGEEADDFDDDNQMNDENGENGNRGNDDIDTSQNGLGDEEDQNDHNDGAVVLQTSIGGDYMDDDDMNGEDEDNYGEGIRADEIFQKQQQLRLAQLAKQHEFQTAQMQLLHEQQEQKLIELHQQLQQANAGDTIIPDQDDSSPGLSLDWQEGFTDEGFVMITTLNSDGDKSLNLSSGKNGNTRTNGKPPTPDFLQPRGPGRPRKGNKSNDISPCPECSKVFVRPDVLKLHYRSVHLNERHPCNMCPKIFKWPGDLSKHKRTKHPEPVNSNT